MPDSDKKGVILFIVLGVIIVTVTLATVILRNISNQSRLTHHNVTRIQAQYASKAGMVLAFDKLRRGDWAQDATAINYYCINGNVDSGVVCLETIPDTEIHCGDKNTPCNIQIAVCPPVITAAPCDSASINNTAMIKVKTDYTYTPD